MPIKQITLINSKKEYIYIYNFFKKRKIFNLKRTVLLLFFKLKFFNTIFLERKFLF
jgi:hypothetical protein